MKIIFNKQSPVPQLLQNNNTLFLYGHRGLSGHYLENTLSSFKYAIECGMDGIELDVQKTLDQELVVFHDKSLVKIDNSIIPITNIAYDDLKNINLNRNNLNIHPEYIPKLSEIIEILPKSMVLNIELKFYDRVKQNIELNIVKLFEKYDLYGNTIVSSFNPFSLHAIKRLNSKIPLALIWNGKTKFIYFWLKCLKPSAIHMDINYVNSKIISWMQSMNLQVYSYTVNHNPEYMKAKKYKLDGIFTDFNSFNEQSN